MVSEVEFGMFAWELIGGLERWFSLRSLHLSWAQRVPGGGREKSGGGSSLGTALVYIINTIYIISQSEIFVENY